MTYCNSDKRRQFWKFLSFPPIKIMWPFLLIFVLNLCGWELLSAEHSGEWRSLYLHYLIRHSQCSVWDTTYHWWTEKIYKQQPRYYVVPRLRLQHFNSPRSFLLSEGQTKEITFHHLRSGEYKLYITSHQSVSCWSTKHHNVGGIISYELTGQQGRDHARHQVDTDPTDGARCDTIRLWSTRFRN